VSKGLVIDGYVPEDGGTFTLEAYHRQPGGAPVVPRERPERVSVPEPRWGAARDTAWMQDAACKGMPTATFFPHPGRNVPEVKAICAGCPVRERCEMYADANHHRHGVWGGKTEKDRRRDKGCK
jgi:WhiB family redox-sensing transcriptional regulator